MEDRKMYRVFWMDGPVMDVYMSEDEAREIELSIMVSSVMELEGSTYEGQQEKY